MRNITQQKEQDAAFRLDLGHYARILWRKKYFLLVPLAIAFIVASIGVRFLVPEYESTSVIKIGNRNNVTNEVERFWEGRGRNRDEKTLAQLEADILASNFLDELIRRIGIDRDPEVIARAELQHQNYPALSTEELVFRRLRDFLKRRIKIESEAPELFRISYSDANADACYVISSALTSLYIEMQQRQTLQSYRDVGEFSAEQLAVHKERLEQAERALTDYQRQVASQTIGTANPVGDTNVALAEKTRADLDLTVRASESALAKIRSRLSGAIGSMPPDDPVWRDAEVSKLVAELGDRRESELLVELSSSERRGIDPTLDPVLASQQALQRRLQQIVLDAYPGVNADYRPLLVEYFYQQSEVRAYRRKLRRVDEYIRQFRVRVALQPAAETELARLRSDVERARSLYEAFNKGVAQAEIGEQAESSELSSTVFVVEAPTRPVVPVRPDKLKILALCFLFGATVGAAGLLLTEFTDSSYRSVEDVEKQLGLRVLGTIPRVGNARWVSDSSRKRTVIWVAVCVTFVCVFISAFYFYGKSSREQMIDLNPALSTKAEARTP